MADIQAKLQTLSEEFTKLQQGIVALAMMYTMEQLTHATLELQTTISSRQKLEAQKAENEGVKKVGGDVSPLNFGVERVNGNYRS